MRKHSRRPIFQKKKICRFCADNKLTISYKDFSVLRYFVTESGKIIPRRISGNCAMHQRRISKAVKRARVLAIVPFTVQSV